MLELKLANQARNAAVLQWHEAEEKAILRKRVDALKDHNMVEYKQLVQVGLCLLACGHHRTCNNDPSNAWSFALHLLVQRTQNSRLKELLDRTDGILREVRCCKYCRTLHTITKQV